MKRKLSTLIFEDKENPQNKVYLEYIGNPNNLEEFEQLLRLHETEFVQGCRERSETKGNDPIFIFKWNNAGLEARIPVAQQANLRTRQNALVQNAADMKDAISRFLCSAPDAATDLGGHHDIFEFRPAYRRDRKMEALLSVLDPLQGHGYLRHDGIGYPNLHEGANQWPDIVDYLQVVTVTAANAAVGPVDVPSYFNG